MVQNKNLTDKNNTTLTICTKKQRYEIKEGSDFLQTFSVEVTEYYISFTYLILFSSPLEKISLFTLDHVLNNDSNAKVAHVSKEEILESLKLFVKLSLHFIFNKCNSIICLIFRLLFFKRIKYLSHFRIAWRISFDTDLKQLAPTCFKVWSSFTSYLIMMLKSTNFSLVTVAIIVTLRIMVNSFINWDLDWIRFNHWYRNVFLNCDWHWLFNWNRNMFFDRVRNLFFYRDSYGFYNLNGNWSRNWNCNRIRLRYSNCHRVRYVDLHWLGNWYTC